MLLLGRAEWRVLCNILNLFVYFLQNKHRLTHKTDQVTILRTLCLGHTLYKSRGSEVSPMRWDHEVAESRLQANLFNFQNNTLCCLRAWPLLITWKSYLFICLFDSMTEREIFCALVCFVNGHTARARQEWGVHSGPSMWVAGVQLLEPSPTASQSVCGTRIKSKAKDWGPELWYRMWMSRGMLQTPALSLLPSSWWDHVDVFHLSPLLPIHLLCLCMYVNSFPWSEHEQTKCNLQNTCQAYNFHDFQCVLEQRICTPPVVEAFHSRVLSSLSCMGSDVGWLPVN